MKDRTRSVGLLNFQKSGDKDEWVSANFKLTSLAGLRKSKRIAEQSSVIN